MNTSRQDARLIKAYLRGDREAVHTIQNYIDKVVKNENWSLRDQWEDITQEIHRRLVTNFQKGRFEFRCPVKSYIYRVSKYTCLAYVRDKYTRQPFTFSLEETDLPKTDPERNLSLHKTVLQLLPAQCLSLLRLYFLEGYSYREIAGLLEIEEGTVKSRFFRCKEKARQIKTQLLKRRELSRPETTPL